MNKKEKYRLRKRVNLVEKYRKLGYCRVSNKYRIIARIDRPDWREYMAKQHAPWDPEGEGMDWASMPRMGDHYRRCYSKDKIEGVSEFVFKQLPGSGEGPDEYVGEDHGD